MIFDAFTDILRFALFIAAAGLFICIVVFVLGHIYQFFLT